MGRPAVLITTKICPDCSGPKYRYANYCKLCAAKGSRNGMHGKMQSDETRALISQKATGRPRPERRMEGHPMWKGGDASRNQGHIRAQSLYPELLPCDECGLPNTERHHIDGDTLNNTTENVVFLCRPHHRQYHPGHGRMPLRLYIRTATRNLAAEQMQGQMSLFAEAVL